MQASIFVTDDEPALRNALVKRLSRHHHRVASSTAMTIEILSGSTLHLT